MDRAVKRVLDGNHRRLHCFPVERAKHVLEARARQHFDRRAKQPVSGLLAESAALALKGHHFTLAAGFSFHSWVTAPSQRRAVWLGTPSRSSTRSTLWSTRSIMVAGW